MFRGERENMLDLTMAPGAEVDEGPTTYESHIAAGFGVADGGRAADGCLGDTVRWAWRTRILVRLGIDLGMRLWQAAEDEAVRVFAMNLRDLLLAAPAGSRSTMGLDPGFRTGVKVAVEDGTGKAVATDTIYPHELRRGGGGGARPASWVGYRSPPARPAPRAPGEPVTDGAQA